MGDGTTTGLEEGPNDGQPLQEQLAYWQSRAQELRNERDELARTVERLTRELEQTERVLAEAQSRSHSPQEQQTPEPFSQ